MRVGGDGAGKKPSAGWNSDLSKGKTSCHKSIEGRRPTYLLRALPNRSTRKIQQPDWAPLIVATGFLYGEEHVEPAIDEQLLVPQRQ
jgi:hypothetical protein